MVLGSAILHILCRTNSVKGGIIHDKGLGYPWTARLNR